MKAAIQAQCSPTRNRWYTISAGATPKEIASTTTIEQKAGIPSPAVTFKDDGLQKLVQKKLETLESELQDKKQHEQNKQKEPQKPEQQAKPQKPPHEQQAKPQRPEQQAKPQRPEQRAQPHRKPRPLGELGPDRLVGREVASAIAAICSRAANVNARGSLSRWQLRSVSMAWSGRR